MISMPLKLLQGQVLVFPRVVRVPVQLPLHCRMEAAVVVAVVVESGAAVAFVDRGEARSPDQCPLWHTAVLICSTCFLIR